MADHRSLRAPQERIETLVQPGSARRNVAAAIVHDVPRHIEQTLFDELRTGALSDNPDDCLRAAKAAVAKGTRPEDIADFYVPALAREMGDQWCKDQLSFAGVTIGTSRLQAVLRALGPNWSGDNVSGPNGPSILLIVGQEVYHTLGAIVLSGQLRRKGFSVKLILGGKTRKHCRPNQPHQLPRRFHIIIMWRGHWNLCAKSLKLLRVRRQAHRHLW